MKGILQFIKWVPTFFVEMYKENSWVYYCRKSMKEDEIWSQMSKGHKMLWAPIFYIVIFIAHIIRSIFDFFLIGLISMLIQIGNLSELATQTDTTEVGAYFLGALALALMFTFISIVMGLIIEFFVLTYRLVRHGN